VQSIISESVASLKRCAERLDSCDWIFRTQFTRIAQMQAIFGKERRHEVSRAAMRPILQSLK